MRISILQNNLKIFNGFIIIIQLLAQIPGVARDSVRNEGTQDINYGII
jgi:hypothetical protein